MQLQRASMLLGGASTYLSITGKAHINVHPRVASFSLFADRLGLMHQLPDLIFRLLSLAPR